jgi:hypothetical protein
MTFRHGTNRAAGSHEADGAGGSPTDSETTHDASETTHDASETVDHNTETTPLSDDQRREWRRWIVEAFLPADYGVVPVDRLVETICDREPEEIDRSTVRVALTETVLPAVDRESVLEYDVDRGLLIKYDN